VELEGEDFNKLIISFSHISLFLIGREAYWRNTSNRRKEIFSKPSA